MAIGAIGSLDFNKNVFMTGAPSGRVSFMGNGGSDYMPQRNNINPASVNGISQGPSSENVKGLKSQSNMGLVERLDRMDAGVLKPNHQDEFRANNLDLYA